MIHPFHPGTRSSLKNTKKENVFFVVLVTHRQCGGCMIFLCPASSFLLPLFPCFLLLLLLLLRTTAVQLTVPVGDDGQLLSCTSGGPPVLWLGTNAVQVFSVKCFPSVVFLRNVRHFRDAGVFRQQGNFVSLFLRF